MSLVDPALLSGLSRIHPQPKTGGTQTSRIPVGPAFEQSLDALLTPKPANQPVELPTEVLGETQGVQFSKHAQNRMASRGLEVDAQEVARLETAVDELSKRGAKESLVLMNDRAYVVGVPKRTVITMMSKAEAMGQVFTNIDSTYVSV